MATTNTRKRSPSKATSSKKTASKKRTSKKTGAARLKSAGTGKKTAKTTAGKATKTKKTTKASTRTKKKIVPVEKPLKVPTPELSNAEKKKIEEARLMKIWKVFKKTDDDNLRNILVETHFPLVKYIAERLLQTLPRSIELGDLISAGTFGLMDAIRGFDLKRGIKFKTYCSTRIRGSILDELRSQDWVPRLVRLKAHRLQKAIAKLEAKCGNEVNDYDLAREMEISIQELSALKTEASPKAMFSLSDKIDDGEDRSDMEKVEIIEDKKGCDPIQAMQQQDVLDLITRNLTKKERLIIIMYYYEGLTMREIGDIMSLTESRVCQIHSNVMSRLKVQIQTISHEGLRV
jgi:RNA polymerase sigma factor for flagellar operon FliA